MWQFRHRDPQSIENAIIEFNRIMDYFTTELKSVRQVDPNLDRAYAFTRRLFELSAQLGKPIDPSMLEKIYTKQVQHMGLNIGQESRANVEHVRHDRNRRNL